MLSYRHHHGIRGSSVRKEDVTGTAEAYTLVGGWSGFLPANESGKAATVGLLVGDIPRLDREEPGIGRRRVVARRKRFQKDSA